jgi:hypothetical protein
MLGSAFATRSRPRSSSHRAGPASRRWLEKAFGKSFTREDTFANVLDGRAYNGRETIHSVIDEDGTTTLRICLILDKSQLELAYPLATLLHAATDIASSASLRFVNDLTAPGEDGVEIVLAKKRLASKPIDAESIGADLAADLYPEISQKKTTKTKERVVINPFTGERMTIKR